MEKSQLRIIDRLLTEGAKTLSDAGNEFDVWRQSFYRRTNGWPDPVDRAVIGGFIADCVAFAFVAGYCSALQSLVPDLPTNKITSFCVTEEGGAHPRAIKTRLAPVYDESGDQANHSMPDCHYQNTCTQRSGRTGGSHPQRGCIESDKRADSTH